ncbi:MAG: hypothetical protein KAX88_05370 [Rhodoferax sp.]|nr:hypothetical protein [Rhodoferax sp.]MBP8183510.1 hypothetical protein [Rhodoferax sp.]
MCLASTGMPAPPMSHPLGATGAIRCATTILALRRNNLRYSMVSLLVGMGHGAAGISEPRHLRVAFSWRQDIEHSLL